MGTGSCDLSVVFLLTYFAVVKNTLPQMNWLWGRTHVHSSLMYSLAAIPGMAGLGRNSQLPIAFFENLRVLILFNYTVVQNFDSSEF